MTSPPPLFFSATRLAAIASRSTSTTVDRSGTALTDERGRATTAAAGADGRAKPELAWSLFREDLAQRARHGVDDVGREHAGLADLGREQRSRAAVDPHRRGAGRERCETARDER